MKHTVRSFSVGLLAAGLIILIVYYFFNNSPADLADHESDEIIAHLEENGYRIVTEKEYISISVASANIDNKIEDNGKNSEDVMESEEDQDSKEEETEETDEETVETKTITIKSGMFTSQISSLLEDEDLVDDADAFNSYLLEHDYSLRVQMGEHELRTDMSFDEIAEAITR